jgi:site-specific DNA-methyltransferase (adenine-specific)
MVELHHGDCLLTMANIPSESIDLIVTDPPYLVNYHTGHRSDKDHKFCHPIQNDTTADSGFIDRYMEECYRILKPDTAMYSFCSFLTVDIFKESLIKAGFEIRNLIVWEKNNWTAGDLTCTFGRQYEFIYLVNKGRKEFNGKRISDVWKFDRVAGDSLVHQNQKPVPLIEQCIDKHSSVGDTVFDGFMGSGTTGIAAVNLDRNFIGVELDDDYFHIAESRIEKAQDVRDTRFW